MTDTGIGIPLEQQERLFERFVQVDQSATRRFGGTGLGTSIAHDLVKLMGGRIGVISAPGKEVTFWIELPFSSGEFNEKSIRGVRSGNFVIGHAGHARDEFIATLRSFGLTPTTVDVDIRSAPTFDAKRYLAAILLLPAGEAAAYGEAVLRDRAWTTARG